MKKTVSVSIDEGIWSAAKQAAYQRGADDINNVISVSQFTEDALVAFMNVLVIGDLDLPEGDILPSKIEKYAVKPCIKIPDQKKIEAMMQEKAKLHDKNKAMLSKIKDTITEIHKSRSETKNPMSGYFKPQPKLKDKRKK